MRLILFCKGFGTAKKKLKVFMPSAFFIFNKYK